MIINSDHLLPDTENIKKGIKKKILFFSILEATSIITACSTYCYFFLAYYYCQRITNCCLVRHSICCNMYILQLWKWPFLNTMLPERLCSWIYTEIWQCRSKSIQGKSKRAETQRQGQKKALEKWILASLTPAQRQKALCTPFRIGKLPSVVAGEKSPLTPIWWFHFHRRNSDLFAVVYASQNTAQCIFADFRLRAF